MGARRHGAAPRVPAQPRRVQPEGESRTLATVAPPVTRAIRRGQSDHPGTTRAGSRSGLARRAMRAEALRLFPELLPDQERVLGRDHPDTLNTRSNIASWTGEVGDARALRLFTSCCRTGSGCWAATTPTRSPPAATSRPGPAEWATRAGRCDCSPSCCRTGSGCWAATTPTRSTPAATSRPGPARWATRAGRCGSSPSCCRTGSGCWAATTPTRSPPAATSRLDRRGGRRAGALQLFTELLPDQERVLGRDHPDTLTTRSNIACWTGEVGRARWRAALRTLRRAAAGPGAGAGPRPPRHAHHPRFRRDLGHQEW